MGISTETPTTTAAIPAKRKGALRVFFSRLFREKKLGAAGAVIVLLFFIVGVFADVLAPRGMTERKLRDRLEGPSLKYPLGTDHLGRDLLSRVIYGAQISMIVGVAASALQVVIATIFGLLSGYFSGKFDLLLQRLVDAWLSFPGLFVILTVMSLLGPGMVQIIIVLGAFWGIGNIRLIRGVVLSAKENQFVEAALAVGCPTWRIILRHILPQIGAPIIVIFTVSLGGIIISEATISFLGFGIPPPRPSWGSMLSAEGRRYMEQAPWLALWPGLFLAIVVFGINVFGDALRDLLDPRLKNLGRFGDAKKLAKKLKTQLIGKQKKE
jgi:peptide/nickel transport system permease protein